MTKDNQPAKLSISVHGCSENSDSETRPADVSPLASVHPQAELGAGVTVGPFSVIGPHVKIGARTQIMNNVTLMGHVSLGEDNRVYPGAVIGAEPQDISYAGADTQVIIGNRNTIRESVTINRASEKEEGITSIGNDCFLMACSHVAHDCRVGNGVIVANCTLLAGHVHVQDYATLSGGSAIHHYTTIGSYSFVSGMSAVRQDVPPYMLVDGIPAKPRCVNVVALKRNNFDTETIQALVEAHRLVFRNKISIDQAREMLRSHDNLVPHVNQLLTFIETQQEGRHGRGREKARRAA